MEVSRVFSSRDLVEAQGWADQQLKGWGVRTPHTARWLRRSAGLLGPDRQGRLVLCVDPVERLVSVDVWHDGTRVFGTDDLV